MRRIAVALLSSSLLLTGCGGDDDAEQADPAECDAARRVADVAIEAWYAQFGTSDHPESIEQLVDDGFVRPDSDIGEYVEVVPGNGSTRTTTEPTELCSE